MGNNLCMVDKSTRGHDVEFEKIVRKNSLYYLLIFHHLLAQHKAK